jgi:hypothetical protein
MAPTLKVARRRKHRNSQINLANGSSGKETKKSHEGVAMIL